MYSVGSIDPDGMLNGWTMKLLSAQASRSAASGRSARGSRRSPGFSCLGGAAGLGRAHSARCSARPRNRSSRGGICRASDYVRDHGRTTAAERGDEPEATLRRRAGPPEPLHRRPSRASISTGPRPTSTAALIEQFIERAERMGFAAARDALFAGEIVNPSEGRAATHVAERGSGAPDEVDLATARRQRMRGAGRRDRSRSVRRPDRHPPHRHWRVGAGPCAPRRRARPPDLDPHRALPLEHRRRGVRRRGEAARPCDDAGHRGVEDFLDAGNAREPGCSEGVASRCRSVGSRRPDRRGDGEARRSARARGSTKAGSCSSAKGSAAVIRCGARSASAPRSRSAGTRSKRCSRAPPRWTATSASPSPRENVPLHRRLRRPPLRRERSAARRAAFSPMTNGFGSCPSISSSWRWNRTASR